MNELNLELIEYLNEAQRKRVNIIITKWLTEKRKELLVKKECFKFNYEILDELLKDVEE